MIINKYCQVHTQITILETNNVTKIPNPSEEISYYFSRQFISDVPIALSLSGGIDSNVIYHCLRKYYKRD